MKILIYDKAAQFMEEMNMPNLCNPFLLSLVLSLDLMMNTVEAVHTLNYEWQRNTVMHISHIKVMDPNMG